MKKKKEDRKITVTHVLADGTQIDSIEGYIIPTGHSFYDVMFAIVEKIAMRKGERKTL